MTESVLISEQDGAIRFLTMNRPESRNALNEELIAALDDAFTEIATDENTNLVVLRAEGTVFSAGHDLGEIVEKRNGPDGGKAELRAVIESCSRMMKKIAALPQPVLASVQGMATAAGCQLVAQCDMAVAARSAKFATPGVNIGLFCTTPMVPITRSVHAKAAADMLLTAEPMTAEQAREAGLISRVFDDYDIDDATLAIARTIAEKPREILLLGKDAIRRTRNLPLENAYDVATDIMSDNLMRDEAVEGISAFRDKRHPIWSHGGTTLAR